MSNPQQRIAELEARIAAHEKREMAQQLQQVSAWLPPNGDQNNEAEWKIMLQVGPRRIALNQILAFRAWSNSLVEHIIKQGSVKRLEAIAYHKQHGEFIWETKAREKAAKKTGRPVAPVKPAVDPVTVALEAKLAALEAAS